MTKRRKILMIVSVVLLLYVGSYVALSVQGQYVPFAWGLGWVKWYGWAPRGFVSGPEGVKGRRWLQMVFLPLWVIDYRFVHNNPDDGKHAINRTLDEKLQKWVKEYNEKKMQNHAVEPTRAPEGARGSP